MMKSILIILGALAATAMLVIFYRHVVRGKHGAIILFVICDLVFSGAVTYFFMTKQISLWFYILCLLVVNLPTYLFFTKPKKGGGA